MIMDDPYDIAGINSPSEKVQLAAVRRISAVIEHIKNPTEKVQLVAVRKAGQTIGLIEKPSEAVQLAAVKQDPYAIDFIKNPSDIVKAAANRSQQRIDRQLSNIEAATARATKFNKDLEQGVSPKAKTAGHERHKDCAAIAGGQ